MMTPLPAAIPSALTTKGIWLRAINFLASSGWLKRLYFALGISYFEQRSFINPLEPSNWAALALGPNALMPAFFSLSTRPATNGASGPTTTKSIFSSLENHNYLKQADKINKIDILFKKIEKKND